MPTATFTCPDCEASIRFPKAAEPGKKIKCPKCSAVVRVPADADEDDRDAIQEKPKRSVAMNGKSTAGKNGNGKISARPMRQSPGVALDELDDEERRRPSKKSKKKKEEPKGMSKGLLMGLIGGGVGLVLLIGVVGTILAITMTGSKGSSSGSGGSVADRGNGPGVRGPARPPQGSTPAGTNTEVSALAYIPADHQVFFGINIAALADLGLLKKNEKGKQEEMERALIAAGADPASFDQVIASFRLPETLSSMRALSSDRLAELGLGEPALVRQYSITGGGARGGSPAAGGGVGMGGMAMGGMGMAGGMRGGVGGVGGVGGLGALGGGQGGLYPPGGQLGQYGQLGQLGQLGGQLGVQTGVAAGGQLGRPGQQIGQPGGVQLGGTPGVQLGTPPGAQLGGGQLGGPPLGGPPLGGNQGLPSGLQFGGAAGGQFGLPSGGPSFLSDFGNAAALSAEVFAVYHSTKPIDAAKLTSSLKNCTPLQQGDKTYYKANIAKNAIGNARATTELVYLYFPSTQIMILGGAAQENAIKSIMTNDDGKLKLPPEVVASIQSLSSNTAWGLIAPSDDAARLFGQFMKSAKSGLTKGPPSGGNPGTGTNPPTNPPGQRPQQPPPPPQPGTNPPGINQGSGANPPAGPMPSIETENLEKLRGLDFIINVESNDVKTRVGLIFSEPQVAFGAKQELDEILGKFKPLLQMMPARDDAGKMVQSIVNSLTVNSSASRVEIECHVSASLIQSISDSAGNGNGGGVRPGGSSLGPRGGNGMDPGSAGAPGINSRGIGTGPPGKGAPRPGGPGG